MIDLILEPSTISLSHDFQFIVVLEPRRINRYENQLFRKLGRLRTSPQLLVSTMDDFIQNLNIRFRYHHWYQHIDWTKFCLAGGSIVVCMLRVFNQRLTSDLDLFYIGRSLSDFLESLVSDT